MANQLTIKQKEEIEVGDIITGVVEGFNYTMQIIENEHWPSWNFVDVETGKVMFHKDIRSKERMVEELKRMNARKVSTITIESK